MATKANPILSIAIKEGTMGRRRMTRICMDTSMEKKRGTMKYRLDVTVNWRDGTEKTIVCNPYSLYNLKQVVGRIIEQSSKDASSFMFVVCESHEKTGEENVGS